MMITFETSNRKTSINQSINHKGEMPYCSELGSNFSTKYNAVLYKTKMHIFAYFYSPSTSNTLYVLLITKKLEKSLTNKSDFSSMWMEFLIPMWNFEKKRKNFRERAWYYYICRALLDSFSGLCSIELFSKFQKKNDTI